MSKRKPILVPAQAAETVRVNFTISREIVDELRNVERAAKHAGLELPTTQLLEQQLRTIVRNARAELEHMDTQQKKGGIDDARA